MACCECQSDSTWTSPEQQRTGSTSAQTLSRTVNHPLVGRCSRYLPLPRRELGVLQATPFRNGRRAWAHCAPAGVLARCVPTDGPFLVRRFFSTSMQHIRWSQPPEAEREGERDRETLKQLVPVQGLVKCLIPAARHQSLRS